MNRPTLRTIARLLAPWRTVRRLEAENQRLRGDLATTKEALQRLVIGGWFENSRFSVGYHTRVVQGVTDWARAGMTGPLPPLPKWVTEREAKASPEVHH